MEITTTRTAELIIRIIIGGKVGLLQSQYKHMQRSVRTKYEVIKMILKSKLVNFGCFYQ